MFKNKVREDQSSLLYLAMCSKLRAPGVIKKIEGIVHGAKSCGYNSNLIIIEPGHVAKYFVFIYKMAFAEEKYVFIRYVNRMGLWIFLAGVILKIRRRKLFVDVPTPMRNHLREALGNKEKRWIDLIDIALIVIQGCVPFLSATKLIQYAEEGKWFSLGVRKKTIKIGNGVDVESIPCRCSAPTWPSSNLNLVAVGTIAFWHGWDKLIEAIRIVRDDPEVNLNINLTIIGDGPERSKLEHLVSSYNLSSNIKFPGLRYGEELYNEYDQAHFGISSLGWSRVGIYEASPLKVREYLAAGLPVIAATKDPDFSDDDSMVINLADDENFDNIVNFIKNVSSMKIPSPQKCRLYAENKLDFKTKMRAILPPIKK
ncbi:MAG: glycosyltransferase [Bacteroidales bacterium]|nr:glycosyltransferase [Bacteroidales bacterium]